MTTTKRVPTLWRTEPSFAIIVDKQPQVCFLFLFAHFVPDVGAAPTNINSCRRKGFSCARPVIVTFFILLPFVVIFLSPSPRWALMTYIRYTPNMVYWNARLCEQAVWRYTGVVLTDISIRIHLLENLFWSSGTHTRHSILFTTNNHPIT